MRRSPRTSLTALVFAVLALAAAGCGGSQVSADEVPGAPVTLTVPSDNELGAGDATGADSSANSGASSDNSNSTDSGTADSGTADPGTTTPPADETGGATTPEATPAPDQAATEATPPPAGSEAQQFEDFCAQNAGAC